MPTTSFPRRARLAAVAVIATGALVGFARPGAAKTNAPVKLSGKVNNHGVGKVKHGRASIELDDFYFDKTFVKGKSGTVTLKLENEGSSSHTFTIDDQNIDVVLAPGDSKEVTVELTDTAPVTFYCRFHVASGMQGALFTKASAAAAKGSASASTDESGKKSGAKSTAQTSRSGGYGYGN